MYVLGVLNPENQSLEPAYTALEDVFGDESFTSSDAIEAISGVLQISPGEASRTFQRLVSVGAVHE